MDPALDAVAVAVATTQLSENPGSSLAPPRVVVEYSDLAVSASLAGGLSCATRERVAILEGVSGVLQPGTLTLVIGPPGSGKTALLRALSGRHPAGGAKDPVPGRDWRTCVTYAGHTASELAKSGVSTSHLAAIAPQDDVHEALLTVRETLAFAHAVSSPRPQASAPADVKAAWGQRVDEVITALGLAECADTTVGSSELRGISGGQRKRMTLAVALLSGARVLAFDGAMNGIDAPRALSIVTLLRSSVQASGATAIVSLESPTPEVFELFDEVVVLVDGHELFHGPPASLKAYLHTLGFVLPRHMDIADFTMHWASSPAFAATLHVKAGAAALSPRQSIAGLSAVAPAVISTDVAVLASIWRACRSADSQNDSEPPAAPAPELATTPAALPPGGQERVAEIRKYLPPAASRLRSSEPLSLQGDAWGPFRSRPLFSVSVWYLLLRREATLLRRNVFHLVAKVSQALVCGFILGAIMWRLGKIELFLRVGTIYFAMVFVGFANVVEVPLAFEARRLVCDQIAAGLYNPVEYSAAVMVANLPLQLAFSVVFLIPIYYLSQFANTAPAAVVFAIWTTFSFLLATCSFMRTIAAASPSLARAETVAFTVIGVLSLFGGFPLTVLAMPPALLFLYYLSPFSWAIRSIATFEFSGDAYDTLYGTLRQGDVFNTSFGFKTDAQWMYGGPVLLMVGYYIVFGLIVTPALLFCRRHATPRGAIRTRMTPSESMEPTFSPDELARMPVDHYDTPGAVAGLAVSLAYARRQSLVHAARAKKAVEARRASIVGGEGGAEAVPASGRELGAGNTGLTAEATYPKMPKQHAAPLARPPRHPPVGPAVAPAAPPPEASIAPRTHDVLIERSEIGDAGGALQPGDGFVGLEAVFRPQVLKQHSAPLVRPPRHPMTKPAVAPPSEVSAVLGSHEVPGKGTSSDAGSTPGPRIADRPAGAPQPDARILRSQVDHALLSFQGISYDVHGGLVGGPTKRLLHDISGVVESGQLMALMGASGAGKTTLLDVLAHRKNTGTVGGKILLNGHQATREVIGRASGFAEQQDVHVPTATVREALEFSATMRLDPHHTSPELWRSVVARSLRILRLGAIEGRRVSDLSASERKLLTIGVELAGNPAILFLDEPTTGLDARAQAAVIAAIRSIAARGCAIVCTVHQPSAEVFLAFTHLLLLAKGGHQIYSGPLGRHAQELIAYFQAIPGVPVLPPHANPATWMLDITQTGAPPEEAGSESSGQPWLAGVFRRSAAGFANLRAIDDASTITDLPGTVDAAATYGWHAPLSFLWQVSRLTVRQFQATLRAPDLTGLRIVMALILGLFLGFGFINTGASVKDNNSARTLASAFCSLICFSSMVLFVTGVPFHSRLRPSFYRERAATLYNVAAYAIAALVAEVPWALLYALLCEGAAYPLLGLRGAADVFFAQLLAHFLVIIFFIWLAQAAVALLPSEPIAQMLGMLVFTLQLLFSGLLPPVTSVRSSWVWLTNSVGVTWATRFITLLQGQCVNYSPLSDPIAISSAVASGTLTPVIVGVSNGTLITSYSDPTCPLLYVYDDNVNEYRTTQGYFEYIALMGLWPRASGLWGDAPVYDQRFQLLAWLVFECAIVAAIVLFAHKFIVWARK